MRRRTRRLLVTGVGLVLLAFVAACGPAVPPPPSSPAAADMVERHNAARGFNGRGALSVDGGMQANAQFHADRLAAGASSCAGSLWHSPELGTWYPRHFAAENVACVSGCPTNAQAAFDLWMSSPPHAANVLGPEYTWIGVATACNGSVQIVVAQYRSD